MVPVLTFGQRQQAMKGLPFYGRGDFSFVSNRSGFTNGISVHLLPLSDLSLPQQIEVDDFDQEIKKLNNLFKKGSRLGGVVVNSTFKNSKGNPDSIIGKFDSFKIDTKHKTIRAFIRDTNSMKLVEVYPETLSKLNESNSHLAKTFLEFLI
jgi:hypothetical protein